MSGDKGGHLSRQCQSVGARGGASQTIIQRRNPPHVPPLFVNRKSPCRPTHTPRPILKQSPSKRQRLTRHPIIVSVQSVHIPRPLRHAKVKTRLRFRLRRKIRTIVPVAITQTRPIRPLRRRWHNNHRRRRADRRRRRRRLIQPHQRQMHRWRNCLPRRHCPHQPHQTQHHQETNQRSTHQSPPCSKNPPPPNTTNRPYASKASKLPVDNHHNITVYLHSNVTCP